MKKTVYEIRPSFEPTGPYTKRHPVQEIAAHLRSAGLLGIVPTLVFACIALAPVGDLPVMLRVFLLALAGTGILEVVGSLVIAHGFSHYRDWSWNLAKFELGMMVRQDPEAKLLLKYFDSVENRAEFNALGNKRN